MMNTPLKNSSTNTAPPLFCPDHLQKKRPTDTIVERAENNDMQFEEDIVKLWNLALPLIRDEISDVSYKTWIEPIKPVLLKGSTICFAAEDFAVDFLKKNYAGRISEAISQFTDIPGLTVDFISKRNEQDYVSRAVSYDEVRPPEPSPLITFGLNPKYTFDSFVVGSSNRFAHAASLAVAEAPAMAYNPLFLYGGSGLGKTHLMQAIGNYIRTTNPSAKILYISAESFTNELINSIKDNTNEQFRNKYRMVDVLMIDDIQFISGKEKTEEEFFHTFNYLHQANKQIVISCDRPPREIHTLEDRLRSRFEWGLLCDIQPPDYETRVAILKKKCQNENLDVPDGVLDFVASKIDTNIRELEGALTRIQAFSRLEGAAVTIDLAAQILQEYSGEKTRTYSVSQIQNKVADYFDISTSDIISSKRNKEIAYARQIAIYICRTLLDNSVTSLGHEFGDRDHSTILHAVKKIETGMKTNPVIKRDLEQIMHDINS